MVLIPSLISPELPREEIIAIFAPANDKRKYGRVALTPSFRVAGEWAAGRRRGEIRSTGRKWACRELWEDGRYTEVIQNGLRRS